MSPDRPWGIRGVGPICPIRTIHCGMMARVTIPLLLALLLALSGSARAVDLDVLVGFGQNATTGARFRSETWTPVTVYLTGQGAHGVGQLQVTVRSNGKETLYTRRVPLSEGAINLAENFAVLLNTENGTAPEIEVRLLLDGRSLAGPKKVALPIPVAPETYNVLGLTRDGSGLNFLLRKKLGLIHRHVNPVLVSGLFIGYRGAQVNGNEEGFKHGINPNAILQPLYTDPRALPALPQGYEMIDAVALADQPLDSLTRDQEEALKEYVREGGLLIISGGGDLARLRSDFFQEMLPISQPQAVIVSALPELERRYAVKLPLAGGTALAFGALKPGAKTLFADASRRPLISEQPYGAGVVVFCAFDYLDRSIRAWPALPALWRDLLRCGNNSVSPRNLLSSAQRNNQNDAIRIADALAGVRASAAPPMPALIGFCIAYLVLLVPINYFILKKLDRREMTWVTAPVLIFGFTIASYLYARSIKGGALTINRAVILETQANSDQIAGYGQMTIYSPRRAAYDISPGVSDSPDNPYRMFCPSEIYAGGALNIGADLIVDNDQTGTTLRDTLIHLWDRRSFDTPVAVSLGGRIDAVTSFDPGKKHLVHVTVTNRTRCTLENCALIGGDQPVTIGTLLPGGSATQTMIWNTQRSAFNIPLTDSNQPTIIPDPKSDAPEATWARIQQRLVQVLSSVTQQNQDNYYNGNSAQNDVGYGRGVNAFVGWFKEPILDVRVDGQRQNGEEVNLLLAHLPLPANASRELQVRYNPFAGPPVIDLEELVRPGIQGVFR